MKTTTKATKKTTKAAAKKAKVLVPEHGVKITDAEFRKKIVRSVEGTASNVRDEDGKKDNRKHILKYAVNGKRVITKGQIIYGKESLAHRQKNVTELTNSKGSVYYFKPLAK